jgi:D-hexose-6-phosphate mutarotase
MQTLKERFDIPGLVSIEPGNGGLTKIVITSPLADAEIYLHGAHVTHFQPRGQQPLLWMSKSSNFAPDKPIRGGVPICFPWFGPNISNPTLPAHGFARLRPWQIESITSNGQSLTVSLSLEADSATRALWPHDFRAQHVVTVGRNLEMNLIIQNLSAGPIRFEEALHTYLTVGDARQISIDGLGGASYIDKVDGAQTKPQTDPQIRFTGETDRVYLNTQSMCTLNDPVMKRKIEIAKSGSNNTVIWNPWINKSKAMPDFGDEEWPTMTCIETANAGPSPTDLPAGATHTMTARISVV